jgi:hypothetical protein
MSIGIKLTGDKELMRELSRLAADASDATAEALNQELLELDAEVVPLVPVAAKDGGNLLNTRDLNHASARDLEAGYQFTAEYATFVHEKTEANFSKPGAQAKFLQEPFERRQGGFFNRLAADIKRRIGIRG